MKKIHEEHTRLSGDGFTAWAVYRPYCQGRSDHYIKGCFDETSTIPSTTTTKSTSKLTTPRLASTTKRSTYSWLPTTTSKTTAASTSNTFWTSTSTKSTLPSTTSARPTTTPRFQFGSTKSTTSLYDFYLNHFGRPNTTPASFAAFTVRPPNSPKPAISTTAARLTAWQSPSDRTTMRSSAVTVAPFSTTSTKYSRFDQLFDNFRHG